VIKEIDQKDYLFRQNQQAACFVNNVPTPYWQLDRLCAFYANVFGRPVS
jgi:hypothetical protein